MLIRRRRTGKSVIFAEPPWPEDSPQWQELDRELDAEHLARAVVAQVKMLDLSELHAAKASAPAAASATTLLTDERISGVSLLEWAVQPLTAPTITPLVKCRATNG